jgi:hypothetical protein
MRVSARQDEVRLLESSAKKRPGKPSPAGRPPFALSGVPPEIDIRGMDSLEAVPVVER